MAKTPVMPKLGVTMDEGRIIEWKIEQGKYVKQVKKFYDYASKRINDAY